MRNWNVSSRVRGKRDLLKGTPGLSKDWSTFATRGHRGPEPWLGKMHQKPGWIHEQVVTYRLWQLEPENNPRGSLKEMSNPKAVLCNKSEGVKKETLRLKLMGQPWFTAYIKILSRLIIELNVKGKIIKCLGGNREYLYDLKRERFLKHYKKY